MTVFDMPLPTVASKADIGSVESIPLRERLKGIDNTYDILKKAAKRYGDNVAIRFVPDLNKLSETRALTYASVFEQVTQIANMFLAHGAKRDSVISLLLPNLPEMVMAMSAVEAVGIVNPISPAFSADEINKLVKAAKSKFLVTVPALWEKLQSADQAYEFEHVYLLGPVGEENETLSSFHAYTDFSGQALNLKKAAELEDVCAYFHTSGTTSAPKLVKLTHHNKVYSAWATATVCAYSEEDKVLGGLPYFHVGAPTIMGNASFVVGAETVLTSPMGWMDSLLTTNFWKIVETFRITSMTALPFTYHALANQSTAGFDVSSLRHALSGRTVSAEDFQAFKSLTGVVIQELYGLTEVTCIGSLTLLGDPAHQGSMGIPLPYTKMKIIQLDDEQDCVQGDVGEVCMKGPGVTGAYLDDSLHQHYFTADGWLRTGDVAYLDDEGYAHYVDHRSFMIYRNDQFLSSKKIEEVLSSLPGVDCAAIIGRFDQAEEQVPVAYVSLHEGSDVSSDPASLLSLLKSKVDDSSSLAFPEMIKVLDYLPLNAMGKVIKPSLKALIDDA